MNETKLLKKSPLPSGFFSICGYQGAGKTSLATALLRTDYKYHRKYRYELGASLAREYFTFNGIKLNVDKTLYFSNRPILLDKKRGIYTHCLDFNELGLPNLLYLVQYLPRGSVVFIEEADVLAYSHNWQNISDYQRDLIKYCRHNQVTIIFDMQVGGDLAKSFRNLVVGQFYVVESGLKRFFFFWHKQVWKFLYIRSQLNNVVKELSTLGVDMKIKVAEWGKFRVWGDVFGYYNSFAGLPYFLKGIENVGYVYKKHVGGNLSISEINKFYEAHPLENMTSADENEPKKAKKKEKYEDNGNEYKPF